MKKIIELIKQNSFYSSMLVLGSTITLIYIVTVMLMSMAADGNYSTEPYRTKSYQYPGFFETKQEGGKSEVIRLSQRAIRTILKDIEGIDFYVISDILLGLSSRDYQITEFEYVDLHTNITDENIFKLFNYTFTEGYPYTKKDMESGERVAVISKTAAFKLLGKSEGVVGKYIEDAYNHERYKVVGVIEDPNAIFTKSYAHVTLSLPDDNIINNISGRSYFTVLRKDGYKQEEITKEINESIKQYLRKYSNNKEHSVTTKYYDETTVRIMIPIIFIFIFLLIPAINSMGISSSYIASRQSEIAIRKSYGARDRDIIALILKDNMIISAIGTIIGIPAAYFISSLSFKLLYMGETVAIPKDIIFNYRLYILIAVSLFIFNLFSVYFPLRKIAKRQIADLIK